ncbi:MAG: hypothetical protein Q8Q38_01140 [bacterium]|nr:hypothetical protein [bacterium]MDZ4231870.1 hypothetical protein [Candidatus Pacearchaeota archaeon]
MGTGKKYLLSILLGALLILPAAGPARALSSGVNVSVEILVPAPSPSPGGGGGGGGGVGASTGDVAFKGKAYPGALLTLLQDGTVVATFASEPDGTFSKTLLGVTSGIKTFSISAEDSVGRKSVTVSFTISVTAGALTTFSGIFLSPTIDVDPVVGQGSTLQVSGYSFPQSQVLLFVNSPGELVEQTNTGNSGVWRFGLDTKKLDQGLHAVRARAQTSVGEQSGFSEVRTFYIVPPGVALCRNGDLNGDGRVNLVDFSIMLFWWQRANSCADQNGDGIVNITDFSILLYWWTG